MSGEVKGREFDEPAGSAILTAQEQLAALSGDPTVMERFQIKARLEALEFAHRSLEEGKEIRGRQIEEYKQRLRTMDHTDLMSRLGPIDLLLHQKLIMAVAS
jgi:hypothetical protein